MSQPRGPLASLIRDLLEAVVLAAVLFVALRIVIQNTVVDGPSMEPNFVDGQWVLVNKLSYRKAAPGRGDVIVFMAPDGSGKEFIKRVIALPGESVALRGGTVSVDGRPIDEPWLPRLDATSYGPYTVPPDTVFVLGDNRGRSNDSRSWDGRRGGALETSAIVGRVWLSVWPPDRWGAVSAEGPAPGRLAGG